jgi:hypothetical protein
VLPFRSLDPFRALREPDHGTKNGLSRSEQKTVSKTQNNHLTGKAPYKFESALLQQRVYELSVPERRTLNDKCRGAIVIITHRGCTRTI